MKIFNIYHHPTKGFEAVKVGFSIPAFLFGTFWLLSKRLWSQAVVWTTLNIMVSIAHDAAKNHHIPEIKIFLLLICLAGYAALFLVLGFNGNEWREKNLSQHGYKFLETIRDETPDAAIAKASELSSTSKNNIEASLSSV